MEEYLVGVGPLSINYGLVNSQLFKVLDILAATNVKVDDPQAGFPDDVTVKKGQGGFVAMGDEKSILDGMRSRGWSEEALKAFKEGKSIRRNITPTPF